MAEGRIVVAIGPRDEIQGLGSVGIEVVPIEDADGVRAALTEHYEREEVAVILLSESVAGASRQAVAALREPRRASILLIPSHRGARGLSFEWMKTGMEQQIGVDMLSKPS